jgi:hypothetical protein
LSTVVELSHALSSHALLTRIQCHVRRLRAVKTRWSDVELEQRTFLETVTAEQLVTVVQYVNIERQTWQYSFVPFVSGRQRVWCAELERTES